MRIGRRGNTGPALMPGTTGRALSRMMPAGGHVMGSDSRVCVQWVLLQV